MTIKMGLFAVAAGAALLLPGCFSYDLPVKQYGIKQEAPVMKSTKRPIASPATPKRVTTQATSSESTKIKSLEKKNWNLDNRMDLLEQRLSDVERKIKTSQ